MLPSSLDSGLRRRDEWVVACRRFAPDVQHSSHRWTDPETAFSTAWANDPAHYTWQRLCSEPKPLAIAMSLPTGYSWFQKPHWRQLLSSGSALPSGPSVGPEGPGPDGPHRGPLRQAPGRHGGGRCQDRTSKRRSDASARPLLQRRPSP